MSESAPVARLVEHLFRREASRLLAGLIRRLGTANYDLAEESVQDALILAMKQWPYTGIPANPAGWLATAAHRKALDALRRQSVFNRIQPLIAPTVFAHLPPFLGDEPVDDQLAMMFACCHPDLASESQIALTLNAVCAFSAAEVARAFLVPEQTVAQRLVRAKRFIRESGATLSAPPVAELPRRLDPVLRVIYLLFNEGYSAHNGDDLMRHDLCAEAIRLGDLLCSQTSTALPKVHALMSLMLIQASRLPARLNASGDLLLLQEQDRSLWDRRMIFAGIRHLDRASTGCELSTYHVQAAIASVHAVAESDDETDWPRLLALYDQLLTVEPSAVVKLNRAVVLAKVNGPAAALDEIQILAHERALRGYYLLPATRAELLRQLGHYKAADDAYAHALELTCNEPERRFLVERQTQCRSMRDSC